MLHARKIVAGVCAGAMILGLSALPSVAASQELPEHHPTQLLVEFFDGVDRDAVHAQVGSTLIRRQQHIDIVDLPTGLIPADARAVYAALPGVRFADPNYVAHRAAASNAPDDTEFARQWHLHNEGQTVPANTYAVTPDLDIDAPEGWARAFGAGNFPDTGGATLGIIDSGIDRIHTEFYTKDFSASRIALCRRTLGSGASWVGECSDDATHGTAVASIAAATANNDWDFAGVAPNTSLAIIKALQASGDGLYGDVIYALELMRTDANADVVNMSIGGPQAATFDAELSRAWDAGIVLVAAAGNCPSPYTTCNSRDWPAAHEDVISVTSIRTDGQRSQFSYFNADSELTAPGENIWASMPGDALISAGDGTSFSSPIVAGVAALLVSELGLDNTEVRQRLRDTAVDVGAPGWDQYYGYGLVNLDAALAGGGGGPTGSVSITGPAEGVTLYSSNVTITGTAPADATVSIADGVTTIGSTTANGSGNWSLGYTFADGVHALTATSGALVSGVRTFTVDTSDSEAPNPPIITSPVGGSLYGPHIPFAGTAEPGATITIREGATVIGTTVANGSGNWSMTKWMQGGNHTITGTATDPVGNASESSAGISFENDSVPPSVSIANSSLPWLTALDGPVEISGFAADNRALGHVRVTVYDSLGNPMPLAIADCPACAAGEDTAAWVHTVDLDPGLYLVYATSRDQAGNGSSNVSRYITVL